MLGLFLFACSRQEDTAAPSPQSPDASDLTIVATVNGDPITQGEFQERFLRAGYRLNDSSGAEVREEFLNRLIEQKMLLKEAQRKRIKIGLAEINERIEIMKKEHGKDLREELAAQGVDFEKWKADLWENLMIERLVGREIDRHVSVSPGEVRRYYQSNLDSFLRPEEVRVRQIVVTTEAEAHALLAQARQGADFASLARERSTAPEASRGGDLGYFARGEMPSEFNIVFQLRLGELSGVVKSPYGYHLFKLEDRRQPGRRGLDDVSDAITQKLQQEKQDALYRRWMKELRSRTKFEVNYQALESERP